VPAFRLAGSAGRDRLLSALAQPQWPHYRTVQSKAAVLHFGLNKNHPFIDGNKRLAVVAMEWFLWRNRVSLLASDAELVGFALAVARDEMSRDESIRWVWSRSLREDWNDAQVMRWLARLTPEERRRVEHSLQRGDADVFAGRARTRSLRRLLERSPGYLVVG
jgi:death on curing protein